MLYPDEGHFFARPENLMSFTIYMEKFFGKCLGGRVEATTAAMLRSSSVQVLENSFGSDPFTR